MQNKNGSTVDELLRYMLILDEDERGRLEQGYAHKLRVGPSGRYGCRLLVEGHVVEFSLRTLPDDSENFVVTRDGNPPSEREYRREVYTLVRHRAAEVMIGIRAGHTEYNKRQKRKKVKESGVER